MQKRNIWVKLLGIQGAVVERVALSGDVLRVHCRVSAKDARRCPECGVECPGYDSPRDARVWRAIPLGMVQVQVACATFRVECPTHGVLQEWAPWARRGSQFTSAFEDVVTWLCTRTDRKAVSAMMQVAWNTVGNILERVAAHLLAKRGALAPVRIGIDEVSYRKGHRYLTVVVDHDTGLLIYASPGKDGAALEPFFKQLGTAGCARITLCSMDASAAFKAAVRTHCPNARLCMDPFHVVQWMTDAVDEVRRRLCREIRLGGGDAADLKGSRFVVLKNGEDLSTEEGSILRKLKRHNRPLYSAYLLKEQLREVFKLKSEEGVALLDKWLLAAARCRVPEVKAVAKSIQNNLPAVRDALKNGLSNARVESLNNRLRLITRLAFGFHSPDPLIALAYLKLGGLCPKLPWDKSTHSG